MDILESCPKHNMVAYLEKSEGSVEFHKVIDFLTRSSIYHALTVSPVVSTTFVEQFWMSAKSKIINNVRYITAKVAGKPVSISEASIRSDLLFDDADGIDSLPNQAIFDAIQLMGYEGDLTVLTFNKALFSPQWSSSDPSPRPSPTPHIPDSILEVSGGNQGGKKSLKSNWMQKESVSKQGREDEPEAESSVPIKIHDEHNLPGSSNMSQAKQFQEKRKKKKNKKKGVEFKDVEETERPRPTSTRSLLTLKPLLKIDPKDKGKKKIEEEDESETESEVERKRLAEEEVTNDALIRNYDDIKARIEADRLLAERLQEEEREQFTVEERAKFLHDTIAAQRRFLAKQISESIRNKPPTKNQLRNQMMTYLKHIKRSDEDFIAIGSAEDERRIKEMNEGVKDTDQKRLKEENIGKGTF
ncbi:hypothetical protein Tco_1273013 [Tanacetum coccineum]